MKIKTLTAACAGALAAWPAADAFSQEIAEAGVNISESLNRVPGTVVQNCETTPRSSRSPFAASAPAPSSACAASNCFPMAFPRAHRTARAAAACRCFARYVSYVADC